MAKDFNFIEVFAGAGGLSEGFIKNGFKPIAFVEMDSEACMTLKTRLAYFYLKKNKKLDLYIKYMKNEITRDELYTHVPDEILNTVFNEEIRDDNIENIFENIKNCENYKEGEIDLIVGGPPCQAYSLVGRAKNKGKEDDDPRNYLYMKYAKFLEEFKPKAFVFENVLGILSAKDKEGNYFFEKIKNKLRNLNNVSYEIDYKVIDASEYGALQARKRVIIFGWRKELNLKFPEIEKVETKAIVNDILKDLPILKAGQEITVGKYRNDESEYMKKNNLRGDIDVPTDNLARPHNKRDLEIYKTAINLWNKKNQRLKYTDLPTELQNHKNQKSFLDRFKVVAGNEKASHTVVAHICKDGHYYIHPDIKQLRSLTVREAARIQCFPDDYKFEGSRSAKFRQIGNAVPVILGDLLSKSIKKLL